MDPWKFYDITHRDHDIMNPISSAGLDEVLSLLELAPGARVLDLGCGKGETLVRLAERFASGGTGVDISPYAIRDAKERARRRAPRAALEFVHMDANRFTAGPGTWDAALCLGATWIHGGYAGVLRELAKFARPGGLVLVAEPFWKREPPPEYLAAENIKAATYGTHASNVAAGAAAGLTPLFATAPPEADFDRYEGLQWRAAERFAAEHPADPDTADLLRDVRRARDSYLKWGREALGQGMYLFRK